MDIKTFRQPFWQPYWIFTPNETCQDYENAFVELLDPPNIGVDTKINFLTPIGSYGLQMTGATVEQQPFCFSSVKNSARGCRSGTRWFYAQDMLDYQNKP